MTVYRTVQISDDQLPKFEKMMEENGFDIILNEAPEIPLEVQKEMQRRWETRHERSSISGDELLKKLRNRK
jgi:hypothetical protein